MVKVTKTKTALLLLFVFMLMSCLYVSTRYLDINVKAKTAEQLPSFSLEASYSADDEIITKIVNQNKDDEAVYEYQFWALKAVPSVENGLTGTRYIWVLLGEGFSNNASAVLETDINNPVNTDGREMYSILARVRTAKTPGNLSNGYTTYELYKVFTPEELQMPLINSIYADGKILSDSEVMISTENAFNVTVYANNTEEKSITLRIGDVEFAPRQVEINNDNEAQYKAVFTIDPTSYKSGTYTVLAGIDGLSTSLNGKIYFYDKYDASLTPVIESVDFVKKSGFTTDIIMTVGYADPDESITEDKKGQIKAQVNSGGKKGSEISREIVDGKLIITYTVTYDGNGIYYTVAGVALSSTDLNIRQDKYIVYYHGHSRGGNLSQEAVADKVDGKYVINNPITITASGSINVGSEEAATHKYAFYREDAAGWVLLKGYPVDGTSGDKFVWTPTKPGNYNIQVRLKYATSVEYEVAFTKNYHISGNELDDMRIPLVFTPLGGGEPVDSDKLIAGEHYRITADYADKDSVNVLYQFTLTSNSLGTVYLSKFSPVPYISYVHSKEQNFRITVRVISESNFGYKDISDYADCVASILPVNSTKLKVDVNTANPNSGSGVTKTQVSSDVYRFVRSAVAGEIFSHRIDITLQKTIAKNYDYVLIDLKMDTLTQLRAILNWKLDIGYNFTSGINSDEIWLYTEDGVMADGTDIKLQGGKWFTLVLTTSKWGTDGDMLSIGLSPNAAVELKNIRYIKQEIFNDIIKPVSFTLSDYSLDLSLGEEESVTASATYKGEPVAASNIFWSVAAGSESIISVVNGKITALATGAAEVIATYTSPDNKTFIRKVSVAVINTLENPINVDISWDFTLATPLEGNSVQYDFPAEIAAEGKTRADIASITNLYGVVVGDSSALDKSKLTVGTQYINFNMGDSTIYMVELIVSERYRAIDANITTPHGSVTKTEISTGVYEFSNSATDTSYFTNRIGISMNTGPKDFDFVLIDLKMDTLKNLKAMFSHKPTEIGTELKDGRISERISLYTEDGVMANGTDVKLQNGEWFTLVMKTSYWGTTGDMLGIGLPAGAVVELKNIRYIKQDIYNDVVKPVSFTLSGYSLDLLLGEEESITATATYKGEPVASPVVSWSVAAGSESIISVVDGKITALAAGAAEVIATYTTPDNKTVARKVTITVSAA